MGSVWGVCARSGRRVFEANALCRVCISVLVVTGSLASFSPSQSLLSSLHLSFHRSSTKHSFPHDPCPSSLSSILLLPPQSPLLPYLHLHSSSLKIRPLTSLSLHQLSQGLPLRSSTLVLIGKLESSHTMSSTSPINGVKISGKLPTSQTVGHASRRVLLLSVRC